MITGSNWEFLPILYLDVIRLNLDIDFFGNSGIIIIVKGRWTERQQKPMSNNRNATTPCEDFSKKFEKPLDKIRYFGAELSPPQQLRQF